MKPIQTLICNFPTTVIFVDDDSKYLKLLLLDLDTSHATFQPYGSSLQAAKYLKEYKSNPFTTRCLSTQGNGDPDQCKVKLNLKAIHEEIYNPDRFHEISVVVVDYDMPGLNGLELCEQLKGRPFKRILLSGVADERIAVQAFNKGLIHQFVRKDAPNFAEEINRVIREAQESYFADLSTEIINYIIRHPSYTHSYLEDPAFNTFLNNICKTHHITEYYLTDAQGSFLLLDKNGKPSCLTITEDKQYTYIPDLKAYNFIQEEKISSYQAYLDAL